MATEYKLARIPSQEFQVNRGNDLYIIRLKNAGQFMLSSITRNGVSIIKGFRVVTGQNLMPYTNFGGNFRFISDSDDIVTFNQFGISQHLRWLSDEELSIL